MAQVFNESYRKIVQEIIDDPNLTPFQRANWAAEKLYEDEEEYDYGTIAKGIIEAYLGYEIDAGEAPTQSDTPTINSGEGL